MPAAEQPPLKLNKKGDIANAISIWQAFKLERLKPEVICERFGITHNYLLRVMPQIEQMALEQFAQEDVVRARRLAAGMQMTIYQESMSAWQKSKDAAVTRMKESGDNAEGSYSKKRVTKTETAGDPRYLQTASQAASCLARLWGVEQQPKLIKQVNNVVVSAGAIATPAELLSQLQQIVELEGDGYVESGGTADGGQLLLGGVESVEGGHVDDHDHVGDRGAASQAVPEVGGVVGGAAGVSASAADCPQDVESLDGVRDVG